MTDLMEQDNNDWEAFRRARLEHMLRASVTAPVLNHRESFQTAFEGFDDDEATLVEAAGNITAAIAPRELMSNNPFRNMAQNAMDVDDTAIAGMSNNPFRNHRSPTVEDVDDEALPPSQHTDVRQGARADEPLDVSQAMTAPVQHKGPAQRIEDVDDVIESGEILANSEEQQEIADAEAVEHWLAALRSALTDPHQGARRLRAMAAAMNTDDEPLNEGDAISRFVAAMPVPPSGSSALRHQLERLSIVLAGGTSTSTPREGEPGSSTQVRPKRQARVDDLRAAAESWQPATIRTDSGTQLHLPTVPPTNAYPSPPSSGSSFKSLADDAEQEEAPTEASNSARASEEAIQAPEAVPEVPTRRITEAEYRRESGRGKARDTGDVYSRLAAPTSAWKAKQKQPLRSNISKPRLRLDTQVEQSAACPVPETSDHPVAGPADISRSSSRSTVCQESDAATYRDNVDQMMERLRSQPVPERKPEPRPVYASNSQKQVQDDGEVMTATVVAPVAIQQAREAPARSSHQQLTHTKPTSNTFSANRTQTKQKAAAPARYARPDPFAPKPDPATRVHARPTLAPIARPRPAPAPPTRQVRRMQSRVDTTARVAEQPRISQAPVWERLSRQSTSASGAKTKRRAVYVKTIRPTDEDHDAELQNAINVSNMAIRAQAANPPRLNNDNDAAVAPKANRQDSRDDTGAAAADQLVERTAGEVPGQPQREAPAPPRSRDVIDSAVGRRRPESIWSSSGIVFTSRTGRNGERPDSTPKDVMPTEAEFQDMVRRAEIEVNVRHASQELGRRKTFEPPKVRKDSALMSSMKNAMSAIIKMPSKMTGIKDSALAGLKVRNRRRSLDSLLERPEIAALQSHTGEYGVERPLLVGRPYETMPGPSRALDIPSSRLPQPSAFNSSRRVLPKPFRTRFFRRTAQPFFPSSLSTHPEEDEAQSRVSSRPDPAAAGNQEFVELPATDADGNVQRRSGETIRVWNEGGATWLHAREYVEQSGSQPS